MAIRRTIAEFSDDIATADIADDAITGGKLANDIAISTTGNIATTGSGTLAVAGASTLTGNVTAAGTLAVTGTSTLTGNATASGNLTVTGDLVPSTPLSNRNLIINGSMQVSQRNSGVVTSATDTYPYKALDRWRVKDVLSTAQISYEQTHLTGANIPAAGLMNAHKISLYGGGTYVETAGAAEYMSIGQRIEAQNISHLLYGTASAKTITLSFYVRSNKDGVYAVSVVTPDGTSYDIGTTYTISGTAWQRVTWTIPGNASGQITDDNGYGMHFTWYLSAGTDSKTTSNTSWGAEAVGRRAYGHTAELFANSGNYIEFTGIQLELGSNATPFEHRSIGDELLRCQRYFYKQQATNTYEGFLVTAAYHVSSARGTYYLPTVMRANPAVSAGGDFQSVTGEDITSIGLADGGGLGPAVTLAIGSSSGFAVSDADSIRADNSLASLEFDAEL